MRTGASHFLQVPLQNLPGIVETSSSPLPWLAYWH